MYIYIYIYIYTYTYIAWRSIFRTSMWLLCL